MLKNHSSELVALVTGASSGLGRVTAQSLVQSGYRVFGTSRGGSGSPPGTEVLTLDVREEKSVRHCVAALKSRVGRLDLLVNNAGVARVGACEETSPEEAWDLLDTNLMGPIRLIRHALPLLREQPRSTIVNVGSLSGFVGVPFHGIYAASKHALAGYTEALRMEVASQGVRVCLIEPAAHCTQIAMARPEQPMSLYESGRIAVEEIIRHQIETGKSPQRVAEVIVRVAQSSYPKARYRVGGKAELAYWARKLLPPWLFEVVMRREFRIPA